MPITEQMRDRKERGGWCMWHMTDAGKGQTCEANHKADAPDAKIYEVHTPFEILLTEPFCKKHMDILIKEKMTYEEAIPVRDITIEEAKELILGETERLRREDPSIKSFYASDLAEKLNVNALTMIDAAEELIKEGRAKSVEAKPNA